MLIFGAGKLGRVACHYFETRGKVDGFIDNNAALWGTCVEGVPVYSPEILRVEDCRIVIAVMYHVEEVKRLLLECYGVRDVGIFHAFVSHGLTSSAIYEDINTRGLIVRFKGGLGNQMFQYALYRVYEMQGKSITADTSFYFYQNAGREFILPNVFHGIHIRECNAFLREYFRSFQEEKNCPCVYTEPILPELSFDEHHVLGRNIGLLDGYFQSYRYPEMIRSQLEKELSFRQTGDMGLNSLIERMKLNDTVCVHIRRGDYASQENINIFGNLWDSEYYARAIGVMKSKIEHPQLCFFSNDMEWVKRNFKEDNAIYVEPGMFDAYEDWYDMCLMSHCKHNIIANSTFSWWGAWLNQNPNKIVIAPRQWMAGNVMLDICPPEWIRV